MEPTPPPHCREMKIRLPSRLATALHARKILTGEQIGTTVERAVRAYYAALDAEAGTETARFPMTGARLGVPAQGGDEE